MAGDETEYREFVAHRLESLRRTAFLLCGEWNTADDLVATALIKLLRHWRRVAVMEHPDAYVRRLLLRAWLDERRRPWRREYATASLPDRMARGVDIDQRLAILTCLAELPPRRRAVVVLRYFCDLSVTQTAAALGCTEGTVKSQTARALETLRVKLIDMSVVDVSALRLEE